MSETIWQVLFGYQLLFRALIIFIVRVALIGVIISVCSIC